MERTQSIEICICTFRRDSLIDALQSLRGTQVDLPVSILVVDNDDTASAKPVVDRFAATSDVPVNYVHCPGANISIARNGALEHSHARYLVFLDDDETASPDWVRNLQTVLLEAEAAAVLGPVLASYDQNTPSWIKRADLHSTSPVFVDGKITTGYSCNVMIDRQNDAFDGLEFDLLLGRTGGEDTAFFTHVHERGGQLAYAPNAVVYEKVTDERACFAWLAKRRYRMGQTHGKLLLRQTNPLDQMWGGVLALTKTGYCMGAALIAGFNPVRRNAAALRGCLHAGTLSAHLGLQNVEIYGQKNKGVTP